MDQVPQAVRSGPGNPNPGPTDAEPLAAEPLGRTARKRREILRAAAGVFLQHGYIGASMDEVAAGAGVSKQTVYKQFADKEHLYAEVVQNTTAEVAGGLAAACARILDEAADISPALRDLARSLLDGLLQRDVLRLRRLILAEADRFPEISGAWFENGFHQALVLLGQALTRAADRGLLRDLADPVLAAYQFAGLVMYKPMNQAMFAGTSARPDDAELDHIASQAVAVFLAAYGPPDPAK